MTYKLPEVLGESELQVARALILQFARSTALADHTGDVGRDAVYLAAAVGIELPVNDDDGRFDLGALEEMGAVGMYGSDGLIVRLRDLEEACRPAIKLEGANLERGYD